MFRDLNAAIRSFPPNVDRAVVMLIALAFIGTGGYMLIEGFSFLDAAYTTVVVLTTIGFGNTEPLDDAGRVFTILLAVFGIGAIFYTLLAVFQFLVEGELGKILGVQRMKSQIQNLSGHYVLCGFGRVGEEVAREFASRGVPFVVIDNNPDAIERARKRGIPLLVGDGTTDDTLRDAGVERAACLLAASDSDAGNTFITLTAKALKPDLFVVARAAHPESQPRMLRAGADRVFSPYVTAGRQMAIAALQPTVVEFVDSTASGKEGERVLAEVDVSPESGLAGAPIEQMISGCKTIAVLGVRRAGGQVIVGPPMSEVLQTGDRVIVLGADDELDRIQAQHSHRRA